VKYPALLANRMRGPGNNGGFFGIFPYGIVVTIP